MDSNIVREALEKKNVQKLVATMAARLVRGKYFSSHESEDIKQDMFIHLFEELSAYDPARGKIEAFIICILRSFCCQLVRSRRCQKRHGDYQKVSLDGRYFDHQGRPYSFNEFISQDDVTRKNGLDSKSDIELHLEEMDIAGMLKPLPVAIRRICELLMENNESSVAQRLGISRRQVANAKSQIAAHLHKYFPRNPRKAGQSQDKSHS